MERKKLEVRSPATQETIAQLEAATQGDVLQAVARARQAQSRWEEKSFAERGKTLLRLRDLLLDEDDKIAKILTAETGKPRGEAYGNELFYVCDAIGFWAKRAAKYLKPLRIRPHLLVTKKLISIYRPIGVVGIISPWNFPLVLPLAEALPALMAGNAVIIKPSELTPLTALKVAELAREAGFPPDLLQVVVGGGEVGETLVDHADMIAFTGSAETGRKVMRRAADRLIPVTLELGGKDSMIVLRDADLERAANACVWGALMNSGQVCTSIERVYVEEPVYDRFVDRLVKKVESLRQGPSDEPVDLGSLNSAAQLQKVESQVAEAVAMGGRVLTGGRRNTRLGGYYYEPTVMVNVKHGMRVVEEETFGPVIPVIKVQDQAEALRLANDCRYGLDSSVFTRDLENAWQIAEKIQAGSVCINDSLVNFVIPEAPMGGIKESGFGHRHGPEGIRKFCRQKTVLQDRMGLKTEFIWFPLTQRKIDLVRRGLRLLFRSGWKNKLRAPS